VINQHKTASTRTAVNAQNTKQFLSTKKKQNALRVRVEDGGGVAVTTTTRTYNTIQ